MLGDKRKIPGVCWDVRSDYFVFSFENLSDTVMPVDPTKRNIVNAVGKFYDPLGFFTPVVVCFNSLGPR